MVFNETRLKGAFLIDLQPSEDERGFFARTFCRREFEAHGLKLPVEQCNLSYNRKKATLRGMHYQVTPRAEAKLVICVCGAIYDVIIDLRAESPTCGEWLSTELCARGRRRMLFVPQGFAHGFQTLEDDSQIFYQMSECYAPGYARGIRWNDPNFQIQWPHDQAILSKRDAAYPDFQPEARKW